MQKHQLEQGLSRLNLAISKEKQQQLLAYLELLDKWNRIYNLTAIKDPDRTVSLHLLDSLAVLPWVSEQTLLDIGSGAGLPGIPLAIVKANMQVIVLDSNKKKTRFLHHVKTTFRLKNVEVIHSRVEDWQPRTEIKQCISRACGSLKQLSVLTSHLQSKGFRLLAMKGRLDQKEVDELDQKSLDVKIKKLVVPEIHAQRHLIIIKKR